MQTTKRGGVRQGARGVLVLVAGMVAGVVACSSDVAGGGRETVGQQADGVVLVPGTPTLIPDGQIARTIVRFASDGTQTVTTDSITSDQQQAEVAQAQANHAARADSRRLQLTQDSSCAASDAWLFNYPASSPGSVKCPGEICFYGQAFVPGDVALSSYLAPQWVYLSYLHKFECGYSSLPWAGQVGSFEMGNQYGCISQNGSTTSPGVNVNFVFADVLSPVSTTASQEANSNYLWLAASCGCSSVAGQPNVLCGSTCVEVQSDPNNCDICGLSCASVFADSSVCVNGACQCPSGTTYCECPAGGCTPATGSGYECSNLQSDPNNCGACGASVPANSTCIGGHWTCNSGYTNCGVECVNLQTDPNNCGGCGQAIPSGQYYACQNSIPCMFDGAVCNNGATIACPSAPPPHTKCGECDRCEVQTGVWQEICDNTGGCGT